MRLLLVLSCSLAALRTAAQAAPLLSSPNGWTCQGQVVDASRRPVLGASVWAKGTHEAATTISEGMFRLSLPMGSYFLLVDYPGHLARETRVSSTDTMLTITVYSTQPRARHR